MVDEHRQAAWRSGKPLELRRREFRLLAFLMQRADQFVSRREILRELWGDDRGTSANSLNVHLSRLRAKLGESHANPVFLHRCRDRGLMFSAQRAHTFSANQRLYVPRGAMASAVRAA